MSLLPKLLQFRDPELSMPLGPAIPRAVEPKPDPIKAFEKGHHGVVVGKFRGVDVVRTIREADCKQSKGAAQPSATYEVRSAVPPRPMPVAAPPSPATPVAVPTFKVGQRWKRRGGGEILIVESNNSAFPVKGMTECGPMYFYADGRVCINDASLDLVELIPSEPKEADGWVEWKGEDCPLPDGTPVEVRYRDGQSYKGRANIDEPSHIPIDAGPCFWFTEGSPLDIVAYRLVKQQ